MRSIGKFTRYLEPDVQDFETVFKKKKVSASIFSKSAAEKSGSRLDRA